jgi:hypothetical protein
MPLCLVTRGLEKWRRRAIEVDSEFGNPYTTSGSYLMQRDELDESIPTPGLPFSSSALTCHTPKAADRLGLALNVGDKGGRHQEPCGAGPGSSGPQCQTDSGLTPPHSASSLSRSAILESH